MVVTSMHIDNTNETVSVRYDEENGNLYFPIAVFDPKYKANRIYEMKIDSEILNKIVRNNLKSILKEVLNELD